MFNWLQQIADYITYNLLGIAQASKIGEAVDFFIYDSVKILILLVTIVSLMGLINVYFPVERVQIFFHAINYTDLNISWLPPLWW